MSPEISTVRTLSLELYSSASPAAHVGNQGDYEQYQENKEQKLGDAGRCDCNTGKPEHRCDDGNQQEHQSPIKHHCLLFVPN
jgi:hypothetical protein